MRLLAISQAVKPTGYARVLRSILEFLSRDLDVLYFGINYSGEAIDNGYPIWPNRLIGDIFGREQLPKLLNDFQPDRILLCHDYAFYSVHQYALTAYQGEHPEARVFFYCPIEWSNIPPLNLASLALVDQLVAYTEFGRRVMENAFERLSIPPSRPVKVLPHGVDFNTFRPLVPGSMDDSKRQALSVLFPDRPDLQDRFLVLNANRNCPRKRVDLTLEAFAEFSKGKPDTLLYLHMGMKDSGCDVLGLAERLGIRDRLLLTTEGPEKPDVTDEHLNLIYNACDAGLNTSTGEGWGLVAFEHAATGAPQIVPNHSACAELWKENGLLIPVEETPDSPGQISVDGAAAALDLLYRHHALRGYYSASAITYVRSSRFSWENIAARWKNLLSESRFESA
jgi:glycosyltransferase involved in cell wall biosynthesis